MKLIYTLFVFCFASISAFAAVDGRLPTTGYVMDAINTKQDKIGGGIEGTVIANTGTAGTVAEISIDTTAIADSQNLITSDAVSDAVAAKQDTITATGETNLLTAPAVAGGQPGTKPVSELATAAQGAKADTAVQSISVESGTNNGTVKVTVDGVTTDNVAITGLGSAAFTDSSAYAPPFAVKTSTAEAQAYSNANPGVLVFVVEAVY